jgi:drug/metabolite transporter (DMT)-like permease
MTLQLGILLSLLCAFASNLAFLYKHRGARAAPAVSLRHPLRSARGLFGSPWFAIGMGVAFGAWLLHVAALALAPLSVVQAVLSGGIVLLGVMAERLFGFKLRGRQWWGIALTAFGLVLLVVTVPVTHNAHSQFSLAGMIGFEGGLIGLGILLIMGPRLGGPVEHHGAMLAAASGFLFGVSDIALKALTGLVHHGGLLALLTPWLIVTAIASVTAFYASARALQVGEAVPVIAVTGSAASVANIAGGLIVFGDPLPGSAIGITLQAIAFAMVIIAAALVPAPVRAATIAPA